MKKEQTFLNLEKQSIVRLSSSEAAQIRGGGIKRSNRLNGGCRYSRKHPKKSPCNEVYGCEPKAQPSDPTIG